MLFGAFVILMLGASDLRHWEVTWISRDMLWISSTAGVWLQGGQFNANLESSNTVALSARSHHLAVSSLLTSEALRFSWRILDNIETVMIPLLPWATLTPPNILNVLCPHSDSKYQNKHLFKHWFSKQKAWERQLPIYILLLPSPSITPLLSFILASG